MRDPIDPAWFQPVHRKSWVVSLFSLYVRRMLGRSFCAVHVHRDSLPKAAGPGRPGVVFLNHASWWDPLVMLWASRILFPDASGYAPIEAAQLSRYAFFRWLGLFAVRGASPGGARDFLRAVERILTTPGAMLWITPEGRFVDVRERPVRFSSGLAHAAVRHPGASFVPLAVEYTFKKERLPEIFLRFGTVQTGRVWGSSVEEAKSRMEDGLRQTEDSLAEDVIAGRRDQFNRLFSGASGTAFPYDGWRRARAWVRGERIELNHSVDL